MLNHHSSNGIFLGYTASMKNVYYIDGNTSSVKMGVHAVFNEAHFTVPKDKAPLAAQALREMPNRMRSEGGITEDKY